MIKIYSATFGQFKQPHDKSLAESSPSQWRHLSLHVWTQDYLQAADIDFLLFHPQNSVSYHLWLDFVLWIALFAWNIKDTP